MDQELRERLEDVLSTHHLQLKISYYGLVWKAEIPWEDAFISGRGDTMEEAILECVNDFVHVMP